MPRRDIAGSVQAAIFRKFVTSPAPAPGGNHGRRRFRQSCRTTLCFGFPAAGRRPDFRVSLGAFGGGGLGAFGGGGLGAFGGGGPGAFGGGGPGAGPALLHPLAAAGSATAWRPAFVSV